MTKIIEKKLSFNPSLVKNANIGDNDDYSHHLSDSSSPSLDSFKIRFPVSSVSLLNGMLSGDYMLVSQKTGEVIDEDYFKKTSYMKSYNGVKTYYRLEKQITSDGSVERYLTVLLTSKILEHEYFRGITKNTVDRTYNNMMRQGIVGMSKGSFMCGELTDTDIKTDIVTNRSVLSIVNGLYDSAIPHKEAHKGVSIYRKKTNLGIQFSLRKTNCFKTSPYLKFYEKNRELTYKSAEFRASYLREMSLPNELMRIETTVKNKKHFKLLGQELTNLNSVLQNLPEVSENAFRFAFNAHLKEYNFSDLPTEETGRKDLAPMDKVLREYLIEKVRGGLSLMTAKDYIIQTSCTTKKQRYRMSKKIDFIIGHIDLSSLVGEIEGRAWFSELFGKIEFN